MAREEQLVHELSQRFLLQKPQVESTAYNAIKDTILRVLREMFAKHPEYTYVPDPERGFDYPDLDKTRISIWQDYPYDTLFLPCITINMGSMRYHPVSFNQNMNTVDYVFDPEGTIVPDALGHPLPNYFEYAGAWDSSFSVNVNAQSPWDRDLITDFITINFMNVYRDWLYTRGVFVKDVSTSGESQVDWRNQHIYKLTLSLELYSEWTHRIPIPQTILESITLKIGAPISSQALVPIDGIVNGQTVSSVATILPPDGLHYVVDFFSSEKPASAMDTIVYNATLNLWQINTIWWAKIAAFFNTPQLLAMLHAKYGITALNQLTTEQWFDILASISSPYRLGYLDTIQDVQEGKVAAGLVLGVDPETPFPIGFETTEYNRLIQLQNLKITLETTYTGLVTREVSAS
jgi:hypothetical protein